MAGIPGLCDEEPEEDSHDSWEWLTGGKLSGEFGIRCTDEKNSGETDTVFKMQFNLDYEVELSDSWEWAIGLRTGSTGRPSRGWISSEDLFEDGSFFIRPWTVTHKGKAFGGDLDSTFGAFEYPFDQCGTLFDGDLMRQGITQQLTLKPDGGVVDRYRFGWSTQYLQNGDTHGDSWVVCVDASLRIPDTDSSRTILQASYIDYINVDSIGEAIITDRLLVSGHAPEIGTNNFITVDGDYASDFNILFLAAEHEWGRGSNWPVRIWGEYIVNIGANGFEYELGGSDGDNGDDGDDDDYDEDEDDDDNHTAEAVNGNTVSYSSKNKGFVVGVDFGCRGDEGDLYMDISYIRLEDDATLELYNRGKFGTNVKGWTAEIRYYFQDDLLLRLEGFWLKNNSFREGITPFNSRIFQASIVAEF